MNAAGPALILAVAATLAACGDGVLPPNDVLPGDITTPPPAIPVVAAVPIPPNYGVHDTFVRDGIGFVCAWNTGVILLDVGHGIRGGTPAAPVEISRVLTESAGGFVGARAHNAWWFHNPTNGDKRYLFVGQEGPGAIGASSQGDIHVVDVSNLLAPVQVARYHMSGTTQPAGAHNFWMDESAQVLYAAYYNGGVVALDVSGTLTGDLAGRELSRIVPSGGTTYVWGVQQVGPYVYAVDMVNGFLQLQRNPGGASFSVLAGGGNVPERFSSDLWVHGNAAYTGTWGLRDGNVGNAVKVWSLSASGAPALVRAINVPLVATVSDLQVSVDGKQLVFTTENGPGSGLHVYSLADPLNPTLLAHHNVPDTGYHTGTVADLGGRRYVFAAANPPNPRLVIYDITGLIP
ncbi:MAG TPA: hypothetical protein VD793_08775 [Gemmatimonadales bacterium]|nr:hypothetical protein [Gemmatimonadales bacterium]